MSAFDDYLSAPAAAPAQSFDAYLGGSSPTPAAVPPALAAPRAPMIAPQGNPALAQDLAAGGASPDTLSQLGQIAQGGAHGIGSMFNNAANFVERQAARAGIFPQTAAADTAAQAQADQQFAQTASPGAKAAAFVAPMLLPMGGAMAPGNALRAGITALPRMGGTLGKVIGSGAGNALTGALMSTGAPIDPNQPAGPQDAAHLAFGAGLGAGLPALASAGKAFGSSLWNAARPIFQPERVVGEGYAAGMSPEDAAAAAASIRNAPQFVRDSFPTTAQVAPSPYTVATEKAAQTNNPAFKIGLAGRENANSQARWNTLNQVAGTPLDLANAQAARDTAANPLYNIAKQQSIPVDAPMTDLMGRPAMASAIKRAQTLADNTNSGPIMSTVGVPNSMGGAPSSMTTLTGNGAQAIKESLDAMLLPENTQKLSSKEIGALQDTRSAYMAWLEGHSPTFTRARQTYAGMSPPINTMQAGQQMVDRLGGMGRALNSSGATQMTAPGYATALSQALGQQEFGIEPAAQTTLENIGRDLQRSTISNSMRSPGSDTAYNLAANGWLAKQLYGPTFGGASNLGKGLVAGAALLTGHPMVGLGILGGANKAAQMVGGRLQNRLSGLLLNPDTVLPYLDARAAGPVYGPQQALNGLLGRNIVPAAVGGISRRSLINSQ
jgi:hypothetical protein